MMEIDDHKFQLTFIELDWQFELTFGSKQLFGSEVSKPRLCGKQ